jgi:hypothetical protein
VRQEELEDMASNSWGKVMESNVVVGGDKQSALDHPHRVLDEDTFRRLDRLPFFS